ncbi:MAG TPA: DUF4976 domain-containing protein [Bacteroidales bacterium]|nr:DUF4976 domain-containing protein [Bacteroidales bacterium]
MTRFDLKLEPPTDLQGDERNRWLQSVPDAVEIEVDGEKRVLVGEALVRWKYQRYLQDYLACVQSVDDSMGQILDYLDQHGLAENTIVIYASDQGFYLGEHGLYDKRFMYEPSLHMPLLVRWPGVTPPGSVQSALTLNIDFAPTLLAMAGLQAPFGMQGRSFVPLLRGQVPTDWRQSMYYRYYHDPGHHNTRAHYGVRTATHKLIRFYSRDEWELYDLVHDPLELHNVIADPDQAQQVVELKAELERLRHEFQDDDRFQDAQPPDGVDGSVKKLRNGQ